MAEKCVLNALSPTLHAVPFHVATGLPPVCRGVRAWRPRRACLAGGVSPEPAQCLVHSQPSEAICGVTSFLKMDLFSLESHYKAGEFFQRPNLTFLII